MKKIKSWLLFAITPFLIAACALGLLFSSLSDSKNHAEQVTLGEHYFNWAEAIASGFSSVDENGEYVLADGEKTLIDLGDKTGRYDVLNKTNGLTSASLGEEGKDEIVYSQLLSAELKNGELNINVISANNVESHIKASADAEFTLGEMVTGGKSVSVVGSKIKLNSGVNSLSAYSSTDAKVAVVNKGTVTFSNTTYGSSTADTAARAFYIDSLSGIPELKLENVKIYRFSINGSGGAICANGGNIYLYGTTLISGCKSTGNHGGAIFMSTNQAAYNAGTTQQQVFMYGAAKIESCSAAGNGGAIYGTWNYVQHGVYLGYSNNSTQANWTGRIYGCTAGTAGGGVWVSGRFYMSSGAVINNIVKSSGNGGGIWSQHGAMGIFGGTISRNSTQDNDGNIAGNGGGIYINNAGNYAKTLSGGTISQNEAGNGAGLFNANTSNTVTLSGTTISENTATTNGGGVYSAGNLTMSGGTIGGSGTANTAAEGGGIYNTGTLTINNANANITYNTATGNGAGVFSSGTLNMSAGTVAYNTASNTSSTNTYGGGIRSAGTTNISGGNINNNSATYGGGVHHATGVLTISGGNIFKNSATHGGGVGCHSGSIDMTGGTIGDSSKTTAAASTSADTRSNYASTFGGGIMIEGSVTLSVSGGTVAYNFAQNGGAIYNHTTGTVNVSGSAVIKYNGSSASGGGIFSGYSSSYTAHKVNISGGSILGNVAGGIFGGGVFNNYGTLTISGGTISQNTASNNGGGVYNVGTFNMTGGTIGGTTAAAANVAANGGGVFNAGTFSFTGGVIGRDGVSAVCSSSNYGNKATNHGSGIYNSGTLTIGSESSTNFAKVYYNYCHTDNNSGTAGGGGLYTTTGFTFSGYAQVKYNYSVGWGGGIMQTGGSSTFESANTAISNNGSTAWGGGIAIYNSGTTLTLKAGTISSNSGPSCANIFAFTSATLNLQGATIPNATVTSNSTFNYTSGTSNGEIYAHSSWTGTKFNINGATGANLAYLRIPDFTKCTTTINTNLTSALKIVNANVPQYNGVIASYGSSTTPNSSQAGNIKLCTAESQTANVAGTYAAISNKNVYSYHKVNINANGGTNSGNSYYEGVYQTSITLPTVTRTGYTFSSWSKTAGNGSLSGSTYTNGSVESTTTANWTANKHNVVLNPNGGTLYLATSANNSSNSGPGTTAYTSSITCPNIVYDQVYGIWSIPNTLGSYSTSSGTAYYSIYQVSRPGYTFNGWKATSGLNTSTAKYGSSSSACTSAMTTSTVVTGSQYVKNLTPTDGGTVTLSAQWTGNTYNITYTLNNGTHVAGFATTFTVSSSQQTKNITYCTRVGYTSSSVGATPNGTAAGTGVWNGLSVSGGKTSNGTVTIPANAWGDLFINFSWRANTHDIELQAPNGEINLFDGAAQYSAGTWTTTKQLSYDTAYQISNLDMANGDRYYSATRTGYTCSGWKISGHDFVSTYAKYGSSSSACTNSLTTSTVIPSTYYIKNFFTDDQGGQGGIELTAQWTANTYTVYLRANGATSGSNTSYTTTYGQTFTLPTVSSLGYAYTDATFAGWASSSTGTSISRFDGASWTYTTTGNTYLYAVFKKVFYYFGGSVSGEPVSYYINGGSKTYVSNSYVTLTAYHKSSGVRFYKPTQGSTQGLFYGTGSGYATIQAASGNSVDTTYAFADIVAGRYYYCASSATPITVTIKSSTSTYGKVKQGYNGSQVASYTRSVPFGLRISSSLNTTSDNWYTSSYSTYIDAYAVPTTSTSTYTYSFSSWSEGSGGVVNRYIMQPFTLTANFTRSGGSGGCVTGDTDILTDFNGTTVKAQNLKEGDQIVAYNSQTGKYELSTVGLKYVAYNSTNLNRLHFADGSHLDITSNHKLMTQSGYYKCVDDGLQAGDVVVSRGGSRRIVSVEALPIEDIVYNFMTSSGDGFVAGGVVIERESSTQEFVYDNINKVAAKVTPGCVTGNTQILVNFKGATVKARELKIGDQIVAYNASTNKYVLTTVKTKYFAYNSQNVYVVTFDDGSTLEITSNHRMLTDSGWKNMIDGDILNVGDIVVGRNGNKTIVDITYKGTIESVVYNFLPKVGDGFVAGGMVIERETQTTNLKPLNDLTGSGFEKVEAGAELRTGYDDGVMSLTTSQGKSNLPDEEDVWLDDKFRLLAQGKSELEVDFDGIHFDE